MRLHKCALISDLDNTLLDSDQRISDKNIAAIRKFTEMGGKFAVATGRAPVSVHKYIGSLGITQGIFCGGAMIYDFEEERAIWNVTMDENSKQAALDVLEKFEGASVQVYTANDVFLLRTNNFLFNKGVREEQRYFTTPFNEIPDGWLKISITDYPKNIPSIHKFIGENYPGLICLASSKHFNEVTDKNASKGTALKAFCALHGIPLERTAVVGDSDNDIPMLKEAGIPMTVANASENVRNAFSQRQALPSNNEDAIAHAIEIAIEMFGSAI